MSTLKAKLYAVAWYKHGAPQHLVAGPYVCEKDADDWIEAQMEVKRPHYVVVETEDMVFKEPT